MRTAGQNYSSASQRRLRCQGLTLTEVMVTSSVAVIALGAFMSINLFALRMNEMVLTSA